MEWRTERRKRKTEKWKKGGGGLLLKGEWREWRKEEGWGRKRVEREVRNGVWMQGVEQGGERGGEKQ